MLVYPLLLLAAVFVGLVAFGLTGSSTGAVHGLVSAERDPDLILGHPQLVRSDEWFVQTTWAISQVEEALPIVNDAFPGGMDATVQHDLPTRDWSTAFRPHLLGFFVLPLDQAMAVKWWFPALALVASAYLFCVTLLPRRPATSLALATAFFFSPFFQWWYLSTTLYPAVWAFLVMSAVVWCLRSQRSVGRWVLAGLVAYATVALGVGVYVPFIVPVVLVAFGFGLGAVLVRDERRLTARIIRVAPVLVAGIAGGAVLALWAVTRWSTIVGFTSTVYPGERLQPVGGASATGIAELMSGFLSFGLERTQGLPFNVNASEASTFLLPGLCLVVPMVWLIIERYRARAGVDWLSIGVLGAGFVMIAFLVVPGWDWLAHLAYLDRTTYSRMRIGFGMLSIVMIVVVTMRMTERSTFAAGRIPLWVSLSSAALAALSVAFVLWQAAATEFAALFRSISPARLGLGAVLVALFVIGVWLFARGSVAGGAAVLLVLSLVSSGTVNPLYRGVFDLRTTETVKEITALNSEHPGAWVGINTSLLPTMMLVESGATSYNGVQGAPSADMWEAIDPDGRYEPYWNRLANVSWVAGTGDPAPRNPYPDQIQMTFDSCSSFAQEHVTWVLAEAPLDQPCAELETTIQEGPTTMHIYRVAP